MKGLRRCAAVLLCMALCLAGAWSATMDARVNAVPKSLMDKVFVEPEETLPSVVANLTNGVSGTASRVKVLHDWICNNIAYDTVIFTDKWQEAQDQSYATVLKKKKAVCAGYTNLMCKMCRLAGIEAVGIEGWSKGFAYRGNVDGPTNHAWNAINMGGGRWQLVDVTWDAGFCDWGYFVKHYSTEWLYRTPREFLYSHLPEEDEYQYYKPLVTKEQFVKEPYVPGIFFEKGFSIVKDKSPLYTNVISESCKYEISCTNSNMMLRTQYHPKDNYKNGMSDCLKYVTWIERNGSRVIVDTDVPDKELYRISIIGRDPAMPKRSVFYSVSVMETDFLPVAEKLLAEKKITERELLLFKESFFKAEEQGRYYFLEDLFATERNRAVEKVFKLMDNPADYYDTLLYFDIKASEEYEGFGTDTFRFPILYDPFIQSRRTTKIISPQGGAVKRGEEVHFAVDSKEYRAFAVYLTDGNVKLFEKNAKTGMFELDFTVPDDMEYLEVMGSLDGRVLNGLWEYRVNSVSDHVL